MRKEILDKVLNKKTYKEVCKEYSGQYIKDVSFEEGKPLQIHFENGTTIQHETIIEFSEDDYGYWIETTNKLWKFDYEYLKGI